MHIISALILRIKVRFRKLLDLVSLDHVAAHKCMFGNELADDVAKKATQKPSIDTYLPVLQSFVKRTLKASILTRWQKY